MSSSVTLAQCRNGPTVIIEVSGEIDMGTSPLLLQSVEEALGTAPVLKVSLRGVDYMDSSGVAVLVQGQKLATHLGRDFRILDPSPQVLAVIRMARLHQVFTIENSEETTG